MPYHPPQSLAQHHSKLGIASFIMSIATGVLTFAAVVIAGIMEVSTPGGINDESISAMLVGFAIIGLLCITVIALGLGIGGLCQKNTKKLFAILGTAFSCAIIFGVVLLLLIGIFA